MDYSSITELDLSNKELTELPDLSAYTNLKKLNCSCNKITHIDNLPLSLKYLDCSYNEITHLDNLPGNLTILYCNYNKLVYNFVPTLENIRKNSKTHK